MKVLIALSTLLALTAANPPAPYNPPPPPPTYRPAPPSYKPAPPPVYPDTAPAYQYQYAVKDDYEGLDFNADESRDGYSTNGVYNVLLPDGRVQTVTYNVADAYSGFVADVTYSEPPPSYKPAPPPTYKPAPRPVYKPAPRPVYRPAPPPAYKPAPPPPPTYKPAPSPVYYKPAPPPPPTYRPAPVYLA